MRRRVLSRNVVNEETLTHWGLSRQNKKYSALESPKKSVKHNLVSALAIKTSLHAHVCVFTRTA
jgi:hypothetical protein